MTDITELAQRMSIERIKQIALGGTPTMGERESLAITALHFAEELKIATDAFQAAGLAQLAAEEALEKAQQRIGKLEKKLTDHKRMNKEMAKAMLTPNDSDAAGMEIAALRQRIAELESRAVKLPKKNIGWDREEDDCWNNAIDACAEVLADAGIKVEAE